MPTIFCLGSSAAFNQDPPNQFVMPHAAARMMRAYMGTPRWLQSRRNSLIMYAVIGAFLVVTATTGLPSSASALAKKTPIHPITKDQAAKQFLADEAPFAVARTAYGNAFASWEAATGDSATSLRDSNIRRRLLDIALVSS
jgi:hypothetical protein